MPALHTFASALIIARCIFSASSHRWVLEASRNVWSTLRADAFHTHRRRSPYHFPQIALQQGCTGYFAVERKVWEPTVLENGARRLALTIVITVVVQLLYVNCVPKCSIRVKKIVFDWRLRAGQDWLLRLGAVFSSWVREETASHAYWPTDGKIGQSFNEEPSWLLWGGSGADISWGDWSSNQKKEKTWKHNNRKALSGLVE